MDLIVPDAKTTFVFGDVLWKEQAIGNFALSTATRKKCVESRLRRLGSMSLGNGTSNASPVAVGVAAILKGLICPTPLQNSSLTRSIHQPRSTTNWECPTMLGLCAILNENSNTIDPS